MVNILAALGVSQMRRLPIMLESKKEIAAIYKKQLANIGVRILEEPHCVSNNWIVNAIFNSELDREKALTTLNSRGIQARPLWTPAHRLQFMSKVNSLGQEFPYADGMWKRTLSLPSSAHLTMEELTSVVNTIKDSLE
jgi:dTDP-4-amino-4,6-dideoxygalactose transaminase